MKKVIASIFVSLDGFIVGKNEDMRWVINNFSDDMGKYAGNLQISMSAVLLGRVTYQIMTNSWPNLTEETSPGAERMNSVPKVVFSRTLNEVQWGKYNSPAEEISLLKQQSGGDLVIYGSANLVQNFTQPGLIDEYQLLVHPVVLGSGKPLFKGITKPINLKLLRTETFKNGVIVLYYARE